MTFIPYRSSLFYLDFANCAKLFLFFFFSFLKTPAGVAWCPSLEAGFPGTDARVCNNTHSDSQADPGERTDSHHACAPERYF